MRKTLIIMGIGLIILTGLLINDAKYSQNKSYPVTEIKVKIINDGNGLVTIKDKCGDNEDKQIQPSQNIDINICTFLTRKNCYSNFTISKNGAQVSDYNELSSEYTVNNNTGTYNTGGVSFYSTNQVFPTTYYYPFYTRTSKYIFHDLIKIK